MSKIDDYIHAATRDNTRRSYQSAVRHFETEWQGFLPATSDSIARYLADHAETLSINTLRQRLAALAQWHISQGFPDPTKSPVVRKVFRGIQALHPAQEKRAKPFQLDQLEQVVNWLDLAIETACAENDRGAQLRHTRNKALLLLGFWRGFRGDELTRLKVEHVEAISGEGMTCFFPQTKGDRQFKGTHFKAPALSKLCPVDAYMAWIAVAQLKTGSVFRAIDRWGHVNEEALHTDSLIPLLRGILTQAGIESAALYSGHSLRRGFANWATANGWDIKTLMEYVGWKNVQSAMRYIESADPFAQHRIETMLSASLAIQVPPPITINEVKLNVKLSLERYTRQVKTFKRARDLIEEFCFVPHRMRRLDKQGGRYQLQVACEGSNQLEEIVVSMLDEAHRIASSNECFIEMTVHDPASGKYWN